MVEVLGNILLVPMFATIVVILHILYNVIFHSLVIILDKIKKI